MWIRFAVTPFQKHANHMSATLSGSFGTRPKKPLHPGEVFLSSTPSQLLFRIPRVEMIRLAFQMTKATRVLIGEFHKP